MHRLIVLTILSFLLGCGVSSQAPQPASPEPVLSRAVDYLWKQQAEDGGWHSETYGLLSSGQSMTGFVLATLLDVPHDVHVPERARIEKAVAFIERHMDASGAVGRADPLCEDYPNYATALALRSASRAGASPKTIARLRRCLVRQQFSETNGWADEHASYGAWGMGGMTRRPPNTGHLDLSMTRYVVEGLAIAGRSTEALSRVETFLRRSQNADGGFLFSPVILDANKGGTEDGKKRSYGTATADGLLALIALGLRGDDERVAAARDWLIERHDVDVVPEIPALEPGEWERAMIYYYRAGVARSFAALGVTHAPATRDWRADLRAALRREQGPDGSFANGNTLMKEDDPLIATAFAVQALVAARDGDARPPTNAGRQVEGHRW